MARVPGHIEGVVPRPAFVKHFCYRRRPQLPQWPVWAAWAGLGLPRVRVLVHLLLLTHPRQLDLLAGWLGGDPVTSSLDRSGCARPGQGWWSQKGSHLVFPRVQAAVRGAT